MNIGKKTSWQLIAVAAAAALLSGVAQADGRDQHRGRGDDSGWRQHGGHNNSHNGGSHNNHGRNDYGRDSRGWQQHGWQQRSHRQHYQPRYWAPPPQHWRHHHYGSHYSSYWGPAPPGVSVVIGVPLY